MLVFKFGGASVKDAEGLVNLVKVVKKFDGNKILIVVSAMGKTTNALEKLVNAYFNQNINLNQIFDEIKQGHEDILKQLFEPGHSVFDEVANTFVEIDWIIEEEPQDSFDFIYDQIVSIGELVSTRIVNAYLNINGIKSQWLDARGFIHTDNTYREGQVQWNKTQKSIIERVPKLLEKGIVLTQGFLGGTSENFTTTLGREGSDYSAAIFAACLGAESVTTWKDVPGILNADPKHFKDTIKFDELTYNEAIEMTFYGASVIHPKTIKPLQNAHIPLLVKPLRVVMVEPLFMLTEALLLSAAAVKLAFFPITTEPPLVMVLSLVSDVALPVLLPIVNEPVAVWVKLPLKPATAPSLTLIAALLENPLTVLILVVSLITTRPLLLILAALRILLPYTPTSPRLLKTPSTVSFVACVLRRSLMVNVPVPA